MPLSSGLSCTRDQVHIAAANCGGKFSQLAAAASLMRRLNQKSEAWFSLPAWTLPAGAPSESLSATRTVEDTAAGIVCQMDYSIEVTCGADSSACMPMLPFMSHDTNNLDRDRSVVNRVNRCCQHVVCFGFRAGRIFSNKGLTCTMN